MRSTTAAPPHRRALKAAVGTLAEQIHRRVVQRITGGTAPVTVAIDGWTNVRQTKVTNVVLLCGGTAFYWCSISNTYAANTAQWLEEQLTPKLRELLELGIRFTALVADNESVNGALFGRLQTPFPFLIRVPCAAHTIQLIVLQILRIDRFQATMATVASSLSRFEKQKADRMRLRQLQQGEAREYTLLKPCDTRWNSQLRAAERIILLRNFITLIIKDVPPAFWEQLAQLIAYLLPFQIATDIMQKDSATLYDVWQQMHSLLVHIAAQKATHGSALTKRAEGALRERWNKQVNQPATIACAILSVFADVSSLSAAVRNEALHFIRTWGASYLLFYKLAEGTEVEIKGRLYVELGHFNGRTGDYSTAQEELELPGFEPLIFWSNHIGELSLVAKALLSVTASEAAVERSFSARCNFTEHLDYAFKCQCVAFTVKLG